MLVVEDDVLVRMAAADQLRADGFDVIEADSLASARRLHRRLHPEVYLVDLGLPDGDGLELVREIRALDPHVPVVVITGQPDPATAVRATDEGATEYLAKPIDPPELSLVVSRAVITSRTARELRFHREKGRQVRYGKMVGSSPPMQKMFSVLERLEEADTSTVLVVGESGTGKELVARAIHDRSRRASRPFVEIDCTGLTDTLIQSQLFGHERGAFTGASSRHAGLFEVAHDGTAFLDEIGELGLQAQSALLRALENRRYRRLGGTRTLELRARVVAATNRDLRREVDEGRFRQDLYFRLNVFPVQVPPLRDRLDDLPALCAHFVTDLSVRAGRPAKSISPTAVERLRGYHWPGNVRELRNVLERAVVMSTGDVIDYVPVPVAEWEPEGRVAGDGGVQLPPRGVDLAAVEASLVLQAIERTQGNQTAAAELLGINRYKLRYKLQKLGELAWPESKSD